MLGIHDETAKSDDHRSRAGNNEEDTPCSRGNESSQHAQQERRPGFHPIRISGEPLSETIIRERRERPY